MILIADSGSTKCSWALCNNDGDLIREITTIGFNPYFIDNFSTPVPPTSDRILNGVALTLVVA